MALIHQWKLTTDANDSVGGLVTTNNGGVTFDPVNGASFNGSSQWLSFVKDLSSMPFSISLWAKFANVNGNQYPFSISDASGSKMSGFNYYAGGEYVFYNNAYFSANREFDTINYPPTKHVMCTLVYDGINKLSLYRDGIRLGSSVSFTVSSLLGTFGNIGRRTATAGTFFNGNLLDVRIYNHALTATEVTSINNAGAGGGSSSTTPPQCYAGGI